MRKVRSGASVADGNESVAETSSGRSGPPTPASSVASTRRSGPCGKRRQRPREAQREMELVRGFFVVGELDDRVLEAEQHPRVDLEREVQVDRTLAALLGMHVDFPRLAQRIALHEMTFVVHVEAVFDRVVFQIGNEAGDVEDCHVRRGYRTRAEDRFQHAALRRRLRRTRPGSPKNACTIPG